MTPSETFSMQIGQFVICAAVVIALAGLVILAVWVWNIALWRIAESKGSYATLQEFLHWKRVQAVKGNHGDPAQTPTACDCLSMGHPEQCAMQPGCRWTAKLERLDG